MTNTFTRHLAPDGTTRVTIDQPWQQDVLIAEEFLTIASDYIEANEGGVTIYVANGWAHYRFVGVECGMFRSELTDSCYIHQPNRGVK